MKLKPASHSLNINTGSKMDKVNAYVYELKLSSGLSTTVTTEDTPGKFAWAVAHNRWYVDQHGWYVNPAHVMMWIEKI